MIEGMVPYKLAKGGFKFTCKQLTATGKFIGAKNKLWVGRSGQWLVVPDHAKIEEGQGPNKGIPIIVGGYLEDDNDFRKRFVRIQ